MGRKDRRFSVRWSGDPLPYEVVGGLFVQWIQHFAAERLGIHQHSLGRVEAQQETTHSFGEPSRMFSVVSSGDSNQWQVASAVGVDEAEALTVIDAALERMDAGDTGEPIVYSTEVTTGEVDIGHPSFSTNFLRLLSSQVHFTGSRRLGRNVLLEVASDPVEGQTLFAPRSNVHATLFVPGPSAGDLSGRIARGMAEIVAAICAFALGRPTTHTPVLFPEDDAEKIATGKTRRLDPEILTPARNHISLDIFEELSSRGTIQATERARGALLAYHAGLQQSVPDLAILLYVISIEALLAPPQNWPQVTKRFITGTQELCPETIEEILDRPDLERGLGFRRRGGRDRQRRDLLNRVYELRSQPVHYGLGLSGGGGVLALGEPEGTRVAIAEQLATAAILGYLAAPRSSIVGRGVATR